MSKHPDSGSVDAPVIPPRRARLRGLLFAGPTLGTTILTLGATAGPKIPPFVGE